MCSIICRSDSRYLLILVESLSVLSIILDEFGKKQTHKPMVVFGSRFKDDVSYTQVFIHQTYMRFINTVSEQCALSLRILQRPKDYIV